MIMKKDDEGNIISPKYWQTKWEATYVFKANIQSLEAKMNIIIDMLERITGKPQLQDFVRPKEAALLLHVTQRHVYSLIKEGKIKAYKAGNVVYIDKNSIAEYVTHQS